MAVRETVESVRVRYPKFVPFEWREKEFNHLRRRVKKQFGDRLGLWITDVRYDRYGLYRPSVKKAVALINGDDLLTFDLSKVSL